ncbi:hypothetical protein C2W62_03125 [Candidatus Entotheonella serta]|nr:hypothetical protein C2W62_03125 [Candidatus Entotheonella serta]
MTELAYLTLAEAAERIRNKQLSPVDYTQALLGRSDDHDAKFNVFLRQTPDVALQHARQAETDLMTNERYATSGARYQNRDELNEIIRVDYQGATERGMDQVAQ